MELRTIDQDATTWLINTAAFRMNDPTTGHNFDPGIKYLIKETDWTRGQPTIEVTTIADVEVLERVQVPKKPRGPRVDRDEGFVDSTPQKA